MTSPVQPPCICHGSAPHTVTCSQFQEAWLNGHSVGRAAGVKATREELAEFLIMVNAKDLVDVADRLATLEYHDRACQDSYIPTIRAYGGVSPEQVTEWALSLDAMARVIDASDSWLDDVEKGAVQQARDYLKQRAEKENM